jgi:hypothetical protein
MFRSAHDPFVDRQISLPRELGPTSENVAAVVDSLESGCPFCCTAPIPANSISPAYDACPELDPNCTSEECEWDSRHALNDQQLQISAALAMTCSDSAPPCIVAMEAPPTPPPPFPDNISDILKANKPPCVPFLICSTWNSRAASAEQKWRPVQEHES